MGELSYTPPVSGGTPHIVEDTYANILALKGSSSLAETGQYRITDYSSGNVGVAQITLQYLANDKLSTIASVQTSHDAEPWVGVYDIVGNQLIELKDNQGNVVTGPTTINSFPWGDANVTNCIVDNSTIDVSGVTTLQMDRVTLRNNSTLDCAGANVLTLNRVKLCNSGVINGFSGSTVIVEDSTITQDARIITTTANSLTVRWSTLTNWSAITNASSGANTVEYCTVSNESAIQFLNTSSNSSVVDTTVCNAGVIQITGTSNTGSVEKCSVSNGLMNILNSNNSTIISSTSNNSSEVIIDASDSGTIDQVVANNNSTIELDTNASGCSLIRCSSSDGGGVFLNNSATNVILGNITTNGNSTINVQLTVASSTVSWLWSVGNVIHNLIDPADGVVTKNF